jgi:hypothetical protein
MSQELLHRAAHVSDDLAEQVGGYVPTAMKRNRRSSPIRVPKLFVGAALTNLLEAKAAEDSHHLPRTQDRERPKPDYAETV